MDITNSIVLRENKKSHQTNGLFREKRRSTMIIASLWIETKIERTSAVSSAD